MLLKIHHQTSYHYSAPVIRFIQLLRCTPQSYQGLYVKAWKIHIDCDHTVEKSFDAYGNILHTAYIEGPLRDVEITVEGEIETEEKHGLVAGIEERLPENYWLRYTPLSRADAGIIAFASAALSEKNGDHLAAMHKICHDLYRGMKFDVGATDMGTSASQAFSAKTGVCQDYAHIMCAAARAMGVPARYVAGYFLRTDTEFQEAGHAWMEAYIPDLGWLAFDPAHGVCTSERYVRVAVGLDALEASPVRGTRAYGGLETLDVRLRISWPDGQSDSGAPTPQARQERIARRIEQTTSQQAAAQQQ